MGTRTRAGLLLMSQSHLVVFIPQGSIMRLVKMECLQLRYEMHL